MADGTNPANDRRLINGSYDSSPLDLDGDGTDDIQYAATKANISTVFNTLENIVTDQDNVFIFTTDHGNIGSTLVLWNMVEMTSAEFATEVDKVDHAKSINVVMEQCYSGGYTTALAGSNRVIATACAANQVSYAMSNLVYNEFVYHWISSINNQNPYGGNVNADGNSDGLTSMLEAFQYAYTNDAQNETPQYYSGANIGTNLSLLGFFPIISGDDTVDVCGDIKEYTLSGVYDCTNITWECSDNLSIVSGQGSEMIYVKGMGSGNGWIKANITTANFVYHVSFNTFVSNPSAYYTYYNYTTTGDMDISFTRGIDGTFIIESGHTVTLNNASLYCTPNAKIIIKPNGKLIVNDGRLTSSCDMWQGIEVWGTPAQPIQAASAHGTIELTNATIENAVCGILVGCSSPTDLQAGMGGGGIVTAENSIFQNNKRSVEFQSYIRNSSHTTEGANFGTFTDCDFITDNNALFSVTSNNAMVRLCGVRDVKFNGCVFQDNQRKTELSDYGIAIYGNSASVSMTGTGFSNWVYPSAPSRYNSFSDFGRAIVLKNTGTKASKINWTNFNYNNVAIYASVSNKLAVKSCNINVNPSTDELVTGRHGIYLEYCDGYIIENNVFYGNGTGLRIKESGTGNNTIQYNNFEDLCLTAITSGVNGNKTIDGENCTGLQFKCNKFIYNDEDIRVENGSASRIRYLQGTPKIGAGNIFDNATVSFRNLSSNYFYYSFNQTIINHWPIIPGMTVIHGNIGLYPVNTHNCYGIGNQGLYYYMRVWRDLDDLIAAYDELAEVVSTKKAIYAELYAGEPINWGELIEEGEAFINKPHVKLFIEIVELTEEIQIVCNEAFELLLDADEFDRVTYNEWLVRENKLSSSYLLAESYVETGNWEWAEQAMEDLRNQFSELTQTEYNFLLSCLQYEYNYSPFSVSENEIIFLQGRLLTFTNLTKAKLQAILELLTGNISCINLADGCAVEFTANSTDDTDSDDGNSQKSTQNKQKDIQSIVEKECILSVYPNPFSDELQLRLDNARDLNIEQVQVYDITGRMLHVQSNIGNSKASIQLSNLTTGVYFIHISLTNGETKVTKVVKQ